MEEKYVKLKHVRELLKLIETRDSFYDWSDSYENIIEMLKML